MKRVTPAIRASEYGVWLILFSEVSSSGVRNTVLVMDRDFSWGLFGGSDQSLGFVGALATMERVSTDIAELCFNR